MAGIYNLFDYLVPDSYIMANGVNSAPLSTWEVDGVLLKTNTSTSATRPNSVSSWRPYPWLQGAVYDFSSIAEPGSFMRFRVTGTVTKAVAFTSVNGMDLFADTVDEGGYYSFDTGWGTETEIYDPSATSVITSFYVYGPGSGGNSLSGLEAEVLIEVEILDPPPPEPITIGAEWGSPYFGTSTSCETTVSQMTDLERVSATLTYYEDSANYTTVQKHCAYGVEWDQDPTETYEIDVETLNLSAGSGNTILLTSFSHEGLYEFRNAMLLIEVVATIDGVQYPTTLTAISHPGG